MNCPECQSDNIFFSKKRQINVCEDCGCEFSDAKKKKIFFSYGHDENAEFVYAIRDAIKREAFDVWIDTSNLSEGANWRAKISSGIAASDFFIAFISAHSMRKDGVCLDEIDIAIGQKSCYIFTVLLEKGVAIPNSILNNQIFDFSEWKEFKQKGGDIWQDWCTGKLKRLLSALNDPSTRSYGSEINELSQRLNPVSMELKQKLINSGGIVGREWIADRISNWSKASDDKIFLIIGAPGSGKSVVSSKLSTYLRNCAAVYYFQWDNRQTRSLNNFAKTIAFQIAGSCPDYRKLLLQNADKYLQSGDLFESLLVTPLNYLIKGNREAVFVVLDALDEVTTNGRNEFAELMSRKIKEFPSWIRFIITSRPDEAVLSPLKQYSAFELKLDGEDNIRDITGYLSQELTGRFCEFYKAVLQRAQGSFLVAKELVASVKAGHLDLATIKDMPSGIAGVYFQNFSRLFGGDIAKYNNTYLPLLCVMSAAKDIPAFSLLSEWLNLTLTDMKKTARKLSSFYTTIQTERATLFLPYHKTLAEWIVSDDAGIFQADAVKGSRIIARCMTNLFLSERKEFSRYYARYGYEHMQESGDWQALPLSQKREITDKLISEAKRIGNKEKEKQFIELFGEMDGSERGYKYYSRLLAFATKADSINVKEIADKLFSLIDDRMDEGEWYAQIENISIALFYIGESRRAYELIKSERLKHDAQFWTKEREMSYQHTISLMAHDLELGEVMADASEKSYHGYSDMPDFASDAFICGINYFDALMAIGKIDDAFAIAAKVFVDSQTKDYPHVEDILHICYANLLQTQGRVTEALYYYESGIQLARQIQDWDYYYGSVWRELALARFGDSSCISNLERHIASAQSHGYGYIESLGTAFCCAAHHIFSRTMPQAEYDKMLAVVAKNGMPGHIATVRIFGHIYGLLKDGFDVTADIVLSCQGFRGWYDAPRLFCDAASGKICASKQNELNSWLQKYTLPIIKSKENFRRAALDGLPDEPFLFGCACSGCEAKCCYDGAYLTPKDELTVRKFVKDNIEYFSFLPSEYIVDGDWVGLEGMKKTQKKPHNYADPKFPAHFTKTRCVFALDDGQCALQRCATDLQLHPWHAKPETCWAFPLRGIQNGKVVPPPKKGEPDPEYVDENYPGYTTFLPCARPCASAKSWKEILFNEILHYQYLSAKK